MIEIKNKSDYHWETLPKVTSILSTVLKEFNAQPDFIKTLVADVFAIKANYPILKKGVKSIYSFKNDFVSIDFGAVINTEITESTMKVYLNEVADLIKVNIEFRRETEKETIILSYNNHFQFVGCQIKHDAEQGNKYYGRYLNSDPVEDIVSNLKRELNYKKYRIYWEPVGDRNEKLVSELKRVSEFFVSNKSIMNSIYKGIIDMKAEYIHDTGTPSMWISWNSSSIDYFNIKHNETVFFVHTDFISSGLFVDSSGFIESCDIYFNEDFLINNITFKMVRKTLSILDRELLTIDLDTDFNIISFEQRKNINKKVHIEKFNHFGLPVKDSFHLMRLVWCENPLVHELIPEIKIPSAYNFYSDEYNDRLLLSSMMLI